MADTFQKVSPGNPLEIPASTWNAVIEAARNYSREKLGTRDCERLESEPLTPALRCYVKNDTAGALAAFSIVKLTTPPILPTGRTLDAQAEPIFSGVAPAAGTDPFAVLIEPLDTGEIGRGVVLGLAVVTLNVISTSDGYAVPFSGNTTLLNSATSGPARILWKSTGGTGSQLAIVLIDQGFGASAFSLDVRNTDGTAVDAATTSIRFNKATGHVASGTSGTSTVDGIDASKTQIGHVNLSNQALGSDLKNLVAGHLNITSGVNGYTPNGAGPSSISTGTPRLILSHGDGDGSAAFSFQYTYLFTAFTITSSSIGHTSNSVTNWCGPAGYGKFSSAGNQVLYGGLMYGVCEDGTNTKMWGYAGDFSFVGGTVHGLLENQIGSGRAGYVAAVAPVSGQAQFLVVNSNDEYWGWRGSVTIGSVVFKFAGGLIYEVDLSGSSQALGTGVTAAVVAPGGKTVTNTSFSLTIAPPIGGEKRMLVNFDTSGGNLDGTLPAAASNDGLEITGKKVAAANTLTIKRSGSDTLYTSSSGNTGYALTADGSSATFTADAANNRWIMT